jgi:membrane-associated phospholipid phosphatase
MDDNVRNERSSVWRGALLSLIVVLAVESTPSAQNRYNVSQFTHETLEFVKQPAKWRGHDWLKLGVITAGTALAMQVDEPIRDAVLRDNGRYLRSVPVKAGNLWGEWYSPPLLAIGFGLHGWLANNGSSKKVGFELMQAVLYGAAVTEVLKFAFGRARPYTNEGAFSFHPFKLPHVGFLSLPGGHVTSAFSASAVLSRNARPTALKILAYLPAALTFGSRVYEDRHWTSDQVLGASVGYVMGNWVVDLHERKQSAARVAAAYPLTLSFSF